MINAFLLIGQSNMAGRGPLQEVDVIENNDIRMFRDNEWQPAKEPLHRGKPNLAGVGLGMSFADTLQRKYDKKTGLIPCTFGETSLREWEQGEKLYTNVVNETAKALRNSRLKGFVAPGGKRCRSAGNGRKLSSKVSTYDKWAVKGNRCCTYPDHCRGIR